MVKGILTKVRTTTRPDHVWPEVWTKIGKAAQNRKKQEWKNEKPKLDNARRLKRIYFIDPDDQEQNETLKSARRKLERHLAAAMPCKTKKLAVATRKWLRRKLHPHRFKNYVWLYSGMSWIHKAMIGIFSTYKTRTSHCSKRIYFDDPLEFDSHVLFLCLKR